MIAPENHHYWLDRDPRVRSVLSRLSVADDPLTLAELTNGPSAATRTTIRLLREHTTLLAVDGDGIRLTVSPQDGLDALAATLAHQVKTAIDDGDRPGVHSGVFLTPDLRLTRRRCDIHKLLQHMGVERLAGAALANRLRVAVAGLTDSTPPYVLRFGWVAREFVSAFARTLTGSELFFDNVEGLRLERDSEVLPQSGRVIVLASILSTEDELAARLDELVAAGMNPVAVATAVDARPGVADGGSAQIAFQTTRRPLIALTSVDIEPRDQVPDDEVVVIHPLLESADGAERPQSPTLVDQRDYLKALKRTRAARLAHIARSANRHYTAYVDPTLLLRDDEWFVLFMKRGVEQVLSAQQDIGLKSASVRVTYPAETGDDIGVVAERLADALRPHPGVRTTVVAPVPRAVAGSEWELPAATPPVDAAEHIVLLDSSTGSGRTVRQLVQIAAAPQVRLITVLVLLNGLDDPDAIALQQIATVAAPADGDAPPRQIPVRMRFFARSAVGSVDDNHCPTCELRREYEAIPLAVRVPSILEDQRRFVLRNLKPQSKRRAFEEEAADLMGMHIRQEDCVAYLRWKYSLRLAETDTTARSQVVAAIDRAALDPDLADALIRLLTAESNWLRSAPLNLASVRVKVTALARKLVVGGDTFVVDPSLRIQAVIVFAAVDPFGFIGAFAPLLKDNRDSYLVHGQVMLEGLRLIVGPEAPWRTSRDAIVHEFAKKLLAVDAELRERRREDTGLPVRRTDIRYLISQVRRRLLPVSADPQNAWATLGRYRQSVNEHKYENIMWRLIAKFNALAEGVRPDEQRVAADWQSCAEFLDLQVLPNLHPLRELLLSPWAMKGLANDDVVAWQNVVNGSGPEQLDELTIRIQSVLSQLDDAAGAAVTVSALVDDLRWWDRFFLTARVQPDVDDRGAFLTEVIKRCPVDIVEVVRAEFDDAVTVDDETSSATVFCSEDLARDVFTHLRLNAVSYHRIPDREPTFAVDVDLADDEVVRVRVRNTNSTRTPTGPPTGGRGVRALNEELDAFGARLDEVEVAEPWTFGIELTVPRWRMD